MAAAGGIPERLDATGLYCPVPVLRTRDRLRRLSPGTELDVLADDPQVLVDMPVFCSRHGHEYLGHREEPGGVLVLRVRRGPVPSPTPVL